MTTIVFDFVPENKFNFYYTGSSNAYQKTMINNNKLPRTFAYVEIDGKFELLVENRDHLNFETNDLGERTNIVYSPVYYKPATINWKDERRRFVERDKNKKPYLKVGFLGTKLFQSVPINSSFKIGIHSGLVIDNSFDLNSVYHLTKDGQFEDVIKKYKLTPQLLESYYEEQLKNKLNVTKKELNHSTKSTKTSKESTQMFKDFTQDDIKKYESSQIELDDQMNMTMIDYNNESKNSIINAISKCNVLKHDIRSIFGKVYENLNLMNEYNIKPNQELKESSQELIQLDKKLKESLQDLLDLNLDISNLIQRTNEIMN